MARDPMKVAKKWKDRLSASTQQIAEGVDAVSTAPTEAAARKADQYVAGVQGSVEKWKRNLRKVGLGDWQSAMKKKGLPRIASGAAAAEDKMGAFMQRFLPHVEAGRQKIAQMPDDSFEARLARMTEMARHNHGFTNG